MSRYSSAPDMSMKGHTESPGRVITMTFMCGTAKDPHKGSRAGAQMQYGIPWRCAKCVSAKSEARNAVACERASITNEKEAQ